MLAYAGNGVPLLPQHGYPLRLVVPGWYGMTSVKWLGSVRVVSEPFEGYQQATAYRMRSSADEPGTPVTRMAPRALMVPPGIPDFMTRERFVDGAEVAVQGRAWSGRGAIDAVEFSSDGGTSWHPAELAAPIGRHAWRGWSYTWRPDRTGRHELCCAARDDAGNRQPLTPPWNLGGYSNNAVQRVAVTVRPPAQ
jgi:DMSO/TMAO reductase YedYZ molybdopterin-dependent catalytic subunit